jgi:hypothetical protein
MSARLALSLLVVLAWPASAHAQTAGGLPGDFGDVVVDTRSPVLYLPVRATGIAPVTIATVQPPALAEFTVADGTCAGAMLAPAGGECFVGVRFSPVGAPGPRSSAVSLRDGLGAEVGTIALSGSGIAPPSSPPGPAGPPGAAGAPGAPGAQGPAGLPGRAIQATCTTKDRPPKTSCRIVVLPADTAATAFRVRLLRGRRTVARGSAPRAGRVKLRRVRRVRPGRYTLAVSFEVDGRTVRARQAVRLR